jgi:hypothetical protein
MEAAAARQEAAEARTVASELTRLTDDNALLAQRLQQMELDVK